MTTRRELASPTRIVGILRPSHLDAFAATPLPARVPDIVEVRLDLAANDPAHLPAADAPAVTSASEAPPPLPDLSPHLAACRRIEETGTPVLCTIRLTRDGGRWTDDGGRLADFERALAVASFVDIELESAIAGEVVARAHALGKAAVVSHHDLRGTPDDRELDAFVAAAQARGADIVKVATLANDPADGDRLVDLMRRHRGEALAVVAMGAVGTPLRAYLPAIGSRLAYGFMESFATGAVAPGQLSAEDLAGRLLRDSPAYAGWRRARRQVLSSGPSGGGKT